jgi:hypothetical protein
MAKAVATLLERAAKDKLSPLDGGRPALRRGEPEPPAQRGRPTHPRRPLPGDQYRRHLQLRLRPRSKKMRARYLALHDLASSTLASTRSSSACRALARPSSPVPSPTKCQATRRVVVVSSQRMLSDLHGAETHGTLDRALRRYVRADLL